MRGQANHRCLRRINRRLAKQKKNERRLISSHRNTPPSPSWFHIDPRVIQTIQINSPFISPPLSPKTKMSKVGKISIDFFPTQTSPSSSLSRILSLFPYARLIRTMTMKHLRVRRGSTILRSLSTDNLLRSRIARLWRLEP